MAGEEPEMGDQVSWQHGSSHPSGEVAEKKVEGELAIQSKKGNTIKKKAEPDNPVVHMAREGNDVVKPQSELQVDEKAPENTTASSDDKPSGEKRDRDEDAAEVEEPKKKARGRPKKSDATPATTAAAPKKDVKAKETPAAAAAGGEAPKKARGRPKSTAGAAAAAAPKEKKEKKAKPAVNGEGIGSRTRSKK
ncbi:hypothetical protein MMC12_002655 [Toensbergia leucococca]|nr:hypothetical protein [Toensbergia leucococca]